jgi:putative hydrolase of the HAD superfamily
MNGAGAPAIKAITFDVGGTLIEPWPSVGRVYAEVARDFGIDVSADQITSEFVRSWKNRKSFGYTRGEWFRVVCDSFGCEVKEEMFRAIYDRFAQPTAWHLFDDVIPALEFAKSRNLKLGIISNWDERLRPLLRELDLLRWFDVVIVSVEVEAHKPDTKIFQAAAKTLELNSREIFHIGDSETEDVIGANHANMQARKIDRKQSTLLQLIEDAIQN